MIEGAFPSQDRAGLARRRFAATVAATDHDDAFRTLNASLASVGITLRLALAAQFQDDQALERSARKDPGAFALLLKRIDDAEQTLAHFREVLGDGRLRALIVLARLPPEVKWR